FRLDQHDVGRLIHHGLAAPPFGVPGVFEVSDDLDLVVRETERIGRNRRPRARSDGAERGQYAASIPKTRSHRSPFALAPRCAAIWACLFFPGRYCAAAPIVNAAAGRFGLFPSFSGAEQDFPTLRCYVRLDQ